MVELTHFQTAMCCVINIMWIHCVVKHVWTLWMCFCVLLVCGCLLWFRLGPLFYFMEIILFFLFQHDNVHLHKVHEGMIFPVWSGNVHKFWIFDHTAWRCRSVCCSLIANQTRVGIMGQSGVWKSKNALQEVGTLFPCQDTVSKWGLVTNYC